MNNFMSGLCCGMALMLLLSMTILNLAAKQTKFYLMGVSDTHKEAFEMGLMIKEIAKDDKVVYRFIETHKLGYE